MSTFIITIEDTENGVTIGTADMRGTGTPVTFAAILGKAMVDNANRYLAQHAKPVDAPVKPQRHTCH